MAENWINKENSRFTVVFSIYHLVTMSRNLVQILIKDSAFCLIQTLRGIVTLFGNFIKG